MEVNRNNKTPRYNASLVDIESIYFNLSKYFILINKNNNPNININFINYIYSKYITLKNFTKIYN